VVHAIILAELLTLDRLVLLGFRLGRVSFVVPAGLIGLASLFLVVIPPRLGSPQRVVSILDVREARVISAAVDVGVVDLCQAQVSLLDFSLRR